MTKAIIGGTGVYNVYKNTVKREVETPFGKVTFDVLNVDGEEICFFPRHGTLHSVPPHKINYKANMAALKTIGITHIYAMVTVGSIDKDIKEGSIVVIDDFLDFTNGRDDTFFNGDNGEVHHVDMTDPYCINLRTEFINKAKELGVEVVNQGVYVATNGPRFETKTEIKMFQMLGGTVVGMTNVPEVVLAKELKMCYSAIGLVSNMGCGMTNENLAQKDHRGEISQAKIDVTNIILKVFKEKLTQDKCDCLNAVM